MKNNKRLTALITTIACVLSLTSQSSLSNIGRAFKSNETSRGSSIEETANASSHFDDEFDAAGKFKDPIGEEGTYSIHYKNGTFTIKNFSDGLDCTCEYKNVNASVMYSFFEKNNFLIPGYNALPYKDYLTDYNLYSSINKNAEFVEEEFFYKDNGDAVYFYQAQGDTTKSIASDDFTDKNGVTKTTYRMVSDGDSNSIKSQDVDYCFTTLNGKLEYEHFSANDLGVYQQIYYNENEKTMEIGYFYDSENYWWSIVESWENDEYVGKEATSINTNGDPGNVDNFFEELWELSYDNEDDLIQAHTCYDFKVYNERRQFDVVSELYDRVIKYDKNHNVISDNYTTYDGIPMEQLIAKFGDKYDISNQNDIPDLNDFNYNDAPHMSY